MPSTIVLGTTERINIILSVQQCSRKMVALLPPRFLVLTQAVRIVRAGMAAEMIAASRP